jgi:hypothetical protein
MNRTSFRNMFDAVAARHSAIPLGKMTWGCNPAPSDECVVVIELQQSSHSKRYNVMMYVFVRGLKTAPNAPVAELAKDLASCAAFRGFPPTYDSAYDLTVPLTDADREAGVESSFAFLDEFVGQVKTRYGLRDLGGRGQIMLPPAILHAMTDIDAKCIR